MPTLSEMVDEVKSKLIGYTMNQDKVTYVNNTSGITATSTSIEVGSSNNFAKGIVEIDDELVWIDSYNKNSATLTVVPGFGRGYMGTTPAPHSRYAQITLAPTFPRINIKQAINDTISAVGDKLYAITSTTFTYNSAVTTYALPDDAHDVLSVTWESVGPSKEWIPVRRWRQDKMANATSFNSTQTVSIYDPITSGRTVQVWYTTPPNTLDANSDDFVDVTGLPSTCRDVIVLGACYRLLSFLDAGRINVTSAEADLNDSKIPANAGVSVSRYVYALFQQRLNEETGRLQVNYPVRIHYNR
jgi:hypothetical protein